MSTAITKSLKQKVKLANQAHTAAEKALNDFVANALKVGEILTEIKAELPHGKFIGFVEQNFTFTIRTAQNYIKMSENREILLKAADSENLSLSSALKLLQKPKEVTGAIIEENPAQSITITFTRAENVLLKELLENGISEKKAHHIIFNRALKRTEKQNQKLLPAPANHQNSMKVKRKEKSVLNQFTMIANYDTREARKLLKELQQLLREKNNQH
jgi:hypothetical protein